jgi:hypothetical protein
MRRRFAILVAAVMLAGCVADMPFPPPIDPVPDLLGTWEGTWGGEPLALLITAHVGDAGYSGVYLGGWQAAGPRRPGVSGMLTSTIRGVPVSSRMEGWLGNDIYGRLVLVAQTETPDGLQRLTLALVGQDELEGDGESSFRWGPEGPVQLTRQAR